MPRDALVSAWQAEMPPPFKVWPDNWDAVRLFQACATQWMLDPLGRECGINYAALDRPVQALRLRGRRARQAFMGLQVMEVATINRRRGGMRH